MKLRALVSVVAVALLLTGVLLRWWFHGSDGTLSIDFGLWDTRACGRLGCTSIAYESRWIDDGWRSPDAVAAFERMLLAARVTLAAAASLVLALVVSFFTARRWLVVATLALAAAVVLGAIAVITHRPTFDAPDMRYFSMRTGLGGGVTIAGAVLAALAATLRGRA